jgi:hypothetical protein
MWYLWQTILLFEDTENSEKFCRQPQHDVKNSELPGGFSKGFELIQIVLPMFPTLFGGFLFLAKTWPTSCLSFNFP